jgi:glycosyltransferase involved in cell wall biosynthesis
MVVGSGWRFTSGISYYTCRLANELAADHEVSALLMRNLVPRLAYPGHARVGRPVNTTVGYDPAVQVFDGVDWHWGRSIGRALRFVRDVRPDVVILQWWTGAVLHSYRAIARQAERVGARVVIEFHEVQDTGEAAIPLAGAYVRRAFPALVRRAAGAIVHSGFDEAAVRHSFPQVADRPTVVAPHGPYDQHLAEVPAQRRPDAPTRLLFFGTIRPYKGLEDLLDAFDRLTPEEAGRLELNVIGETWEGWTRPIEMIGTMRHRDRVRLTNRYVTDDEIEQAFAAADLVVLPYRRSSSSGPLHITMSAGLPVVVTQVGGLVEASEGYAGLVPVPPGDPVALCAGIRRGLELVGRRYPDVRSWDETRAAVAELLDRIGTTGRARRTSLPAATHTGRTYPE